MQNNNNTSKPKSEDGFQTVKSKRGPGPRGQKIKDRQQKAKEEASQKPVSVPIRDNKTYKELLFELDNLKKYQHSPKVDLKESTLQFHVSIELPGVSSNDVKLYVRDSKFLLVTGNKHTKNSNAVLYTECNYGFFTRRVKVPSLISNIFESHFENGVLYVTLYKMDKNDNGKVQLDTRLDEKEPELPAAPVPSPIISPIPNTPVPLDFTEDNTNWGDDI